MLKQPSNALFRDPYLYARVAHRPSCLRNETDMPLSFQCVCTVITSSIETVLVLLAVSRVGMLLKGGTLGSALEVLEARLALDGLGSSILVFHVPVSQAR